MKTNKLILLGSLLLGSAAVAGFSCSFDTAEVKAENIIQKEDAWNDITGKSYYCSENQVTLDITGETIANNGSFTFTFSDSGTTPITTLAKSFQGFVSDGTKVSFLSLGGITISFAPDYQSVSVEHKNPHEVDGTYTIVLPAPNEEKLSTGAIVGISAGAVVGVSLITYATMFGIFVKTKTGPKFLIKSFEGILKLFKNKL